MSDPSDIERRKAELKARLAATKSALQAKVGSKRPEASAVAPAPPAQDAPVTSRSRAVEEARRRAAERAASLGLGGARAATGGTSRPSRFGPPTTSIAQDGAAAPSSSAGASQRTTTFMPAPLRLDEYGREIDEHGRVVKTTVVRTLEANRRAVREKETEELLELLKPDPDEMDPEKNPYFDPRVGVHNLERKTRDTFNFVEDGRYTRKAERQRARAAAVLLEEELKRKEERQRAESAARGEIYLGSSSSLPEDAPGVPRNVPNIEWWDRPVAGGDHYPQNGEFSEKAITDLVQHPAQLEPVNAKPDTGPIALPLTKKERKKLRHRRRVEKQMEIQDKIRMRIIEPPPPRVTMSNFMRVLGQEAVKDPTKVEAIVKKQIEERKRKHDEEIEKNRLTPDQRREKVLRKFEKDKTKEVRSCAFRVQDLSQQQHRFKVDINARQNHLTGRAIVWSDFSVVIIEGGAKAIKHYKRLMLHRIDWSARDDEGAADDDDEAGSGAVHSNRCDLLWEGAVTEPLFHEFKTLTAKSEDMGREMLVQHNAGHFWDLAKRFGVTEAAL